jgi:DNA polymerase I
MHHILFKENPSNEYNLAILVKTSSFNKTSVYKHYVKDLVSVNQDNLIAFSLEYKQSKPTASQMNEYLNTLLPILASLKVSRLLVADSNYFKQLTKVKKVSSSYGYVLPCAVKGYEYIDVVLSTDYKALIYKPELITNIELASKVINNLYTNTYKVIGQDIIKQATYITEVSEVANTLSKLFNEPELTLDIETFSLKFYKAGIATIGFASSINTGVVIQCDYQGTDSFEKRIDNQPVKYLLKEFFLAYKGKLVLHNANFDFKVLVYELFMDNLLDREGMLHGIETLCKNFDDTKLITYLATNSCSGNNLSLKHNAHEFAGNYAQEDINDVTLIPTQDLMKYNLVDCLATWFVKDKYYPQMIQDNQLYVYETIMKPSVSVLLQMELVGVPIDMEKVKYAQTALQTIVDDAMQSINNHPLTQKALSNLLIKKYNKDYEERKSKAVFPNKIKPKDWDTFVENNIPVFNPNSNAQVSELIYNTIGLPVIDYTKTKLPAVGAKTLKKLLNHTTDDSIKALIEALRDFYQADKVNGTFIKAFVEHSILKDDGCYYLHGSFNIGGTVSGRLSSSSPNLQTIPSGSKFSKLIKDCFMAPKGWLLIGADFNALEARIGALLPKDPAKLIIYTDGYDSHSYATYGYWPEKFEYVRQANENEIVAKVISDDGSVTYLKEGDTIEDSEGNLVKLENHIYI